MHCFDFLQVVLCCFLPHSPTLTNLRRQILVGCGRMGPSMASWRLQAKKRREGEAGAKRGCMDIVHTSA